MNSKTNSYLLKVNFFVIMQSCDVRVGPDSVGHQLQQEALAFGGTTVTSTDIAMVTGLLAPFSGALIPKAISCQTAYAVSMQIYKMIGDSIDVIKVCIFICNVFII